MSRWAWPRLGVLALIVAAGLWWGVAHGVGTSASWRHALGGRSAVVAVPIFIVVYVAATVALLPAGALSLAAGVVFGPVVGVVAVWIGAVAGSAAAFGIGRALSRPAVQALAGPRLARLDGWLGQRGLAAVLAVRLVPVFPFGWINYAAAATALRWRPFLVGTAVGILPGTVAYVVLGSAATRPGSPEFWGALAGFAVLTVGGSLLARRHRGGVTQQ